MTRTEEALEPEKFPPEYDRTFQARMLRTLYQDPNFTCTTGVFLSPYHFERKVHRWLAQQILEYAGRHHHGIGRDALKIARQAALKKGRLVEKDLPELDVLLKKLRVPVKDRSFVQSELFRFIKNQTSKDAILRAVDHLDRRDFDQVDREIQRILDVQMSATGGAGHFYVRDRKVRTERRKRFERNGVPTGWKLDQFLKPGGLPPKAIGIVVAGSNRGKSHLLVDLGCNAIIESPREERVLHITLEDSEDEVVDRYDARIADVSLNELEQHAVHIEEVAEDLGRAYGDCLVVKEMLAGTTTNEIRTYIRQLQRTGFYPTLLIIDYADEMETDRRYTDDYDRMGYIYSELRRLAGELMVPIWTASQTPKTALDKQTIDDGDIADSFKKYMKAHLVVAWAATREEQVAKRGRLVVLKNKIGPKHLTFKAKLDTTKSKVKCL